MSQNLDRKRAGRSAGTQSPGGRRSKRLHSLRCRSRTAAPLIAAAGQQIQDDLDLLRPARLFANTASPVMLGAGPAATPVGIDEAYSIQRAAAAVRAARGDGAIGYKVGCTGPAVRKQLGMRDAVHGHLWANEQHVDGVLLDSGAYRGLAIEGELAVRLLSVDGPVAGWLVEWFPVIELHHKTFDGSTADVAVEIITKNCIHAGVVHPSATPPPPRCTIAEIPLDAPITVALDGKQIESSTLALLELEGLRGPHATITWLQIRLAVVDQALKPGDVVLAATPGGLYPIGAGTHVDVQLAGQRVRCSVK